MHLPYSFVWIRNTNTFTYTDAAGQYWLTLPVENENDTLTFSHPGYDDFSLPVKTLVSSQRKNVPLKKRAASNPEISFSKKRMKEIDLGFKDAPLTETPSFLTINQDEGFELAQSIPVSVTPCKVTSVNVYFQDATTDSCTFRIQFYSWNGTLPGPRMIEQDIIQTQAVSKGWLRFDLNNEEVILKDSFLVSISLLPSFKEKAAPVHFMMLPGTIPGSFTRLNRLGSWEKSSSPFNMFVTVLAKKKKKKRT